MCVCGGGGGGSGLPHGDVLLEAGAEASGGDVADDLPVHALDLRVGTGRGAGGDEAHAPFADSVCQLLLDDLMQSIREKGSESGPPEPAAKPIMAPLSSHISVGSVPHS